jgi:hypothetical protein
MSENKYSWLEFDELKSCDMHDQFEDANKKINLQRFQIFTHAQRMQHSKDKAIMLKLLEIIETQNEAFDKAAQRHNIMCDKECVDACPVLIRKIAIQKTEQMLNELKGE